MHRTTDFGSKQGRTFHMFILPDEAYGVVTENRALLQHLLAINIEAEKPKMVPSAIVEMVLFYFSGLCMSTI